MIATSKQRLADHLAEAHKVDVEGRSKAWLSYEHARMRCAWRTSGPAPSKGGRRPRQVQMARAFKRVAESIKERREAANVSRETLDQESSDAAS